MSHFFTIITASLDMAGSLRATIESVKNQSFKSCEHIIVDGGSSDNTLELLGSYDDKYNMKWISESDRGVPDAFNKAIKLSSGKYIIAIQADDYLLNTDILDDAYKIISVNNHDIYSFPILKEISPGVTRRIDPIRHLWWIRFRNLFPHQGIFVRRDLFDRIGQFDTRFTITEDYDFLYRALNAGSTVSFEELPVAFMGGEGPCSVDRYLSTRLHEEYELQAKNEKNIIWRFLQIIFWIFYYPYKTRFLLKTLQ